MSSLQVPSRPPLSSNGSENLKLVKDLPGYTTLVFAGKDAQRTLVEKEVAAKGFVSAPLVSGEVAWFYTNLSIDDTYFANESPAVISDHSEAPGVHQARGEHRHRPREDLRRRRGRDFHPHQLPPSPVVTFTEGPGTACEARIDDLFLDTEIPYRLGTFRSQGAVSATASQKLRCYFVSRCAFPPLPKEDTDDIRAYSDPVFLEKVSENTLAIRQSAMQAVKERRYGPVLSHYQVEGTRQHRLVIAYDSRASATHRFFSALSNLYHFYALYSVCKYVE
ncbi:hypothetical protein B0H11DRAFT_1756208 [Mycena galericulata]|nr:hypothetical protein B0H11DRAFT_1756208 [Mycena galericulata]